MKIEILGPGCPRCETLKGNAQKALDDLGMTAEIEKVTDLEKIIGYGVMATPGIVIDGRLRGSGKVFTVAEIKAFLDSTAKSAEI